MKNLLISLCLFVVLAGFGLFVFIETTEAQNSILTQLLNVPAPPPPNSLSEKSGRKRSPDFFSKKNPPDDNAPIEDLLDYWRAQSAGFRQLGYNIKPSERSLERILEEIERNPESLGEFLNILPAKPEVAEIVKRLYDAEAGAGNLEDYELEQIKRWLGFNSSYFSDELYKVAQTVGDADEYVTNQAELLALARVDWDKAQPILDRLYNDRSQPVSQTLARWAFYEKALREGNSIEADRWRDELKTVVEDKSALPGNRDLALDALTHTPDFSGRDEWYFSLLEDETLHDLRVGGQVYTGLTTLLLYSPPEKYVEKMLELLNSGSPAVRNAAVRNLTTLLAEGNPEVVRALLPWLENPKWAKENASERRTLVAALQNLEMPESVPGLIAVLNEKNTQMISYSANTAANTSTTVMANTNVAARSESYEYYPYRSTAVGALAKQKDARAVPYLRQILPEVEQYERVSVVAAILASGGFSVGEQVDALENHARNLGWEAEKSEELGDGMLSNTNVAPIINPAPRLYANTNAMTYDTAQAPFNPAEIKIILGMQLAALPDPSSGLVAALIERINVLDTKEPQAAMALRSIVQSWKGAAINRLLLSDLKNGKSNVEAIIKLLSLRKELQEKHTGDISDIRGGTPVALGIAACLSEDAGEYDAILAGENAETKIAMLGCARLIRAKLPLQQVAGFLKSPNKLLALAAERYLESEDSPEARQIVLSLHPNEAKVLGARTYFAAGNSPYMFNSFLSELFASVNDSFASDVFFLYRDDAKLEETEKRLQKEVKENQEILGVYAYNDNFIWVYKDRAVFNFQKDPARYHERVLTDGEFNYFKSHLISNNVDQLAPFLSACDSCEEKELVMLGRAGGRRVFVKAQKMPPFFAGLERIFEDFRKPPGKLRYHLEKKIPGLEILFADESLQARSVWKNGGDLRVLIDDNLRREQVEEELGKLEAIETADENLDYDKWEEMRMKRRRQREFEHFSWQKLSGGKLAELAGQPPQFGFPPVRDQFSVQPTVMRWKAKAAKFEIRADAEGLYKITGGQIAKIRSGYYDSPLVTSDGRWAIAVKYGEEENSTVRVNLQTNKEFKIKLDEYPIYTPVSYIPSLKRVLMRAGGYADYEYEEAEAGGDYYLLDAETGAVEKVAAEKIAPLAQQSYRPLQSATGADEFWAAISDREKNETQIGVYNAKNLSFIPLMKIPQIVFDSMSMWVDAGENKIYVVYEGQLFSLPLK